MRIAILSTLILLSTSVHACSIPVFHYALKRWESDPYHLVLHGPEESPRLAAIAETLAPHGLTKGNVLVWRSADEPLIAGLRELADSMPATDESTSRWFLTDDQQRDILLGGAIESVDWDTFADSPARRHIVRRLLHHDAIVWVLIDVGDEQATHITERLDTLAEDITIAVDPGDWSDPAYGGPDTWDPNDLHAQPRFSIVRVASDDPQERSFVQQLRALSPRTTPPGPLVVPVFGRARMLRTFSLMEFDDEAMHQTVDYLTGECSCTVKALNPGIDLPIAVEWEALLEADADLDALLPPWPVTDTSNAPTIVAGDGGSDEAGTGERHLLIILGAIGTGVLAALILISFWLINRRDG